MLMMYISTQTFSQIDVLTIEKTVNVGEVKNAYSYVAGLSYVKDGDNRIYTMRYRDVQYTQLVDVKSISFGASEDEIEQLYQLMVTIAESNKGETRELKLGNGRMTLVATSSMGVKYVVVYAKDDAPMGSFLLRRKDIDKLFGKESKRNNGLFAKD